MGQLCLEHPHPVVGQKEREMLIAIVIALVFCQADIQNAAVTKTRDWGPRSGSFQLSIFSNKDTYMVGEEVQVTAVLKNVTDAPAWVQMTTPAMFYDMEIRPPFPAWINFKPRAALTSAGQKMKSPSEVSLRGGPLTAGRELAYEFDLSKLYEMSASGEYTITFSCRLPLKERGDPRVAVTSNELKITIKPK